MSHYRNSTLILLFFFLMSPFLACLVTPPTITNHSEISDNFLEVQTWDSEFQDWYCISNPPPYPSPSPNDDDSWMARIAIDSLDVLHVVWSDRTDDPSWGVDDEILYSQFNGTSWSTPIAISHNASWSGTSDQPSIAIDSQDNIHVVWSDGSNHLWQNPPGETDILYSIYSATSGTWSAPICISDDMSQWNTGDSKIPFIAIDSNDDLHVVWHDATLGQPWNILNGDTEILYINQINGVWGTTVIPISDDLTDINTAASEFPSIAVDGNDNLHIVWEDEHDNLTPGGWGTDQEILYRNFTVGSGWQPIYGLSGLGVNNWNNDLSRFPIIAIDPNTDVLHVVWQDDSNGIWGPDIEIFYSNSTNGAIWTNATALSGIGVNTWNNDHSYGPWITVDNLSIIHVVWHDDTNSLSEWGDDREIFYSNSTNGVTWLNATCLSDQPDYSNMPNTQPTFWGSEEPCIAYDSTNFVHIVWWDESPNTTLLVPGWSDFIGELEIFYTTDYLPVGIPVLQSIIPNPSTNGAINLNWTPAANAAYYKIYRHTQNITISGLGGLTPIATTRSTTYTDTMGTNGKYYYAIVAHNVGGDGSTSNCKSVDVELSQIPWWIWIIIISILLLILILLIYNRRKKKKKQA